MGRKHTHTHCTVRNSRRKLEVPGKPILAIVNKIIIIINIGIVVYGLIPHNIYQYEVTNTPYLTPRVVCHAIYCKAPLIIRNRAEDTKPRYQYCTRRMNEVPVLCKYIVENTVRCCAVLYCTPPGEVTVLPRSLSLLLCSYAYVVTVNSCICNGRLLCVLYQPSTVPVNSSV